MGKVRTYAQLPLLTPFFAKEELGIVDSPPYQGGVGGG